MAEEGLDFYQHFYTENLFIFPERGPMNKTAAPAEPSPAEKIDGDTTPNKKYNLLGENKKGLIILVSVSEQEFTALPKHDFLSKILAAIKHSANDVAFINLRPGEKLQLFDLTKETTVNNLIAFGPGLIDLSSDSRVHLYKPASIGKVPLLIAEPLENIELDVNKKKQLWSALQSIFLK